MKTVQKEKEDRKEQQSVLSKEQQHKCELKKRDQERARAMLLGVRLQLSGLAK